MSNSSTTIPSFLGLAIGSALGAPVYGFKEGHIRQLIDEVTGYVDPITAFPDKPGKWRKRALYAGAAQQAMAIADVLAIYGEADVAALADLYVRLADAPLRDTPASVGALRMPGHFFRKAVQAMRENSGSKNFDFRQCGQVASGSGAAARIAPVGLFYADDPEAMARATIDFSLMTHHDPRAIAGALAVAYAVAALSQGTEPLMVADNLHGFVRQWEETLRDEYGDFFSDWTPQPSPAIWHGMSNALKSLPSLLREDNLTLAAQTILEAANAAEPFQPVANPHGPFAPACVTMALYRALSARSFLVGMLETVNAGSDTESVSAIVGALLGARFGLDAIPAEWRAELVNKEQVLVRARGLQDHEADWSILEDYVQMETDLTRDEADHVAHAQKEQAARLGKVREKMDEKKARQSAQAAKKKEADSHIMPFASTPQDWKKDLQPGTLPPLDGLMHDPIQAKKDRALRGRKRIPWKTDQREKHKGEPTAPDEDDNED